MKTARVIENLERVPETVLKITVLTKEYTGPDGRINFDAMATQDLKLEEADAELNQYCSGVGRLIAKFRQAV